MAPWGSKAQRSLAERVTRDVLTLLPPPTPVIFRLARPLWIGHSALLPVHRASQRPSARKECGTELGALADRLEGCTMKADAHGSGAVRSALSPPPAL